MFQATLGRVGAYRDGVFCWLKMGVSQGIADPQSMLNLSLPASYVTIAIENGHRHSKFSH